MRSFAIASALAIASTLVGTIALSIPYNGQNVYRVGNDRVVISGTANQRIQIEFDGVSVSKTLTADACGYAKLDIPRHPLGGPIDLTDFKANGVSYDPWSYLGDPDQGFRRYYQCINGQAAYRSDDVGAYDPATLAYFRKGAGNQYLYWRVGSAGAPVTLSWTASGTRNISINACGFVAIRGTVKSPISANTNFTYSGQSYTVGSLQDAVAAPRCTAGTGYRPTGIAQWGN